ncbi:MAG: ABC-2 type transporter [Chloroflexi bacterium]|nr:ABC-2 type transporter [Chloroflexota bacterium]
MISDIGTVIWRERKTLFRYRGSRLRTVLSVLVPVVLVAVYFPWQVEDWADSYASLFSAVVPMMMVLLTVPDSFAGERERHTLGTLLSTRLPDRAILFGKLVVSVGLGFWMMLGVLALALVTANTAHWDGQVHFYSATVLLVDLGFGLLLAALIAGAGVLISLRASTVQEAQQLLGVTVMTPPMVLGLVALLLRERIADLVEGVGATSAVLIVMAALAAAAAGLVTAAAARFRRARLILD